MSADDKKKNVTENVPLGWGMASQAKSIMLAKRKRDRDMAKRFNSNN